MSVVDLEGAGLLGLRMTADEFLALPEDPLRYELVDGVVVMSPSPGLRHQRIESELIFQVRSFLDRNPIGEIVADIDTQLGPKRVYRPDLVFLTIDKVARCVDRVTEIPDLVVEIVSPQSRGYDARTKRQDYQTAGIQEYWLIDPEKGTLEFFQLADGEFRLAAQAADEYASPVLGGMALNLARVRALF